MDRDQSSGHQRAQAVRIELAEVSACERESGFKNAGRSHGCNKAKTVDGGKTWQLVADGQTPNYRSCVQYIPNRNGQELIAVGFKGIDYSNDGGDTWKTISDEGFFTVRFIDENTAYAAGSGRISKITLK